MVVQLIAVCYFAIALGMIVFEVLLARKRELTLMIGCQLSFIACVFIFCGCHYISEESAFHVFWDKYVLLPFAFAGALCVNPVTAYLVFERLRRSMLKLKEENERLIKLGFKKAKGDLEDDSI